MHNMSIKNKIFFCFFSFIIFLIINFSYLFIVIIFIIFSSYFQAVFLWFYLLQVEEPLALEKLYDFP